MTRNLADIVGRACRLPGAASVADFWSLLDQGRCAVRPLDPERWSPRRYWHPRRPVAGKTYAEYAGLLDDIYGFDPAVFGISPREAEQMDPQQRLSLELVWEALEDAGIAPSSLAGSETGVFVGASALDYAGRLAQDVPSLDAYFATGNTLSIISNRLSYIFDLRGPSYTVDTACSSALVAFNEAVEALNAGRIDTALVVGVNILLSPIPFVGFSQANMLSKRGLCRAFDADADGYVRAEGGVAFILRRPDLARARGERAHARVAASGVNQDGRTVGMSFPSAESQIALLERIYGQPGIDLAALAFVEAHGTGTKVGDPAEARAVGAALARGRDRALPIGSAKTNVGHLEPASGLVGMLKAMLALEHDRLPASLHLERLNPEIPFADLNVRVAGEPIDLPRDAAPRLAGINSFGFGGTNAHVVVADPEPVETAAEPERSGPVALVLSAASKEALGDLVARFSERLADADEGEVRRVAAAAGHSRDRMGQRLVVDAPNARELRVRLDAHREGRRSPGVAEGGALGRALPVAFVYTGNGSQWAGMGRRFLDVNPAFRARFHEVDRLFADRAGWSLADALHADDLGERLRRAEIAQPLLFAIQAATTAALIESGVRPAAVFGHSVGEVAAAAAAGALGLEDAVAVIHARSVHQEIARDTGTMAAVRTSAEEALELIADPRCAGLELAAVNSPKSVTISGPHSAIEALARLGRERRVAVRVLDLGYPFHSALIERVRDPLLETLAGLTPRPLDVPFLSTVEGAALPGEALDAGYWWRNVREPVRFADAVGIAAERGVRVFLEVGPKPILQAYLRETLGGLDVTGAVLVCADSDAAEAVDPARAAVGGVLTAGGEVDLTRFVGPAPRPTPALPAYPWQRRRFVAPRTVEATDTFGFEGDHPLIAGRVRRDATNWFVDLDPALVPELADHVVAGSAVLPGAGLIEIALAAGREILATTSVELTDFEILHALTVDADGMREMQVRFSPESRTVEVLSRQRLHGEAWITHAVGRIAALAQPAAPFDPASDRDGLPTILQSARLYRIARDHGLDFGPRFQRMAQVERRGRDRLTVKLTARHPATAAGYGLDPTELDGTFQSIIALFAGHDEARPGIAFLPARFGEVRLFAPGVPVAEGRVRVRRASERSIEADFDLVAADGTIVATIRGGRFRASSLTRPFRMERVALRIEAEILEAIGGAPAPVRVAALNAHAERRNLVSANAAPGEDALLLDAFAAAAAEEALRSLVRGRRRFNLGALVGQGKLAEDAVPLAARLLSVLEDQGRVTREGEAHLFDGVKRPRAAAILGAVLAEHPERGAEAVLGARAAALLPRFLAEGRAAVAHAYSAATLVHAETGSPGASARIAAIDTLVQTVVEDWPANRPLRVVELAAGAGGLSRALARRLGTPRLSLTVTDPDGTTVERLSVALGGRPGIRFARFDPMDAENAALPPHDIVVSAGGLSRLLSRPGASEAFAKALNPGARILVADAPPSPFADLVHGFEESWFARSIAPEFPVPTLRDAAEWVAELTEAGFSETRGVPLSRSDAGVLVTGTVPPRVERPGESAPVGRIVVVGGSDRRDRAVAQSAAAAFAAEGRHVDVVDPTYINGHGPDHDPVAAAIEQAAGEAAPEIVHLAGAWSAASSGAAALIDRTDALRRLLPLVDAAHGRLWVVAPGGLQGALGGGRDLPLSAGVVGFARVAANEFKTVDLRVVDVSLDLDAATAGARLAMEVLCPRADREIVVTGDDVRAPRMRVGLPQLAAKEQAPVVGRRLGFGAAAGLDELAWEELPLEEPGPGDVAIDVAATGLNFRDVMWAMGLLPEEALEDGFAGPTLGLEVAGTVAAVGRGVKGFAPGDEVIGFVAGGFASRLITPAPTVARLPGGLSFAAAATIPVAFLTAYHALIDLGRLSRGERVLIHGGAGGVGLAALQIAKWRGAEVFTTAGSAEKRDFLTALGADHVLNSRDLGFSDAVMALTDGEGVDVVLNSLSGDAMEKSLRLVRPFGRFLELGKRDYYANTRIGLRPFRRNVAYFGIDADQLFSHDPARAEKLFRKVVSLFEDGTLAPLPFRRFDGEDVVEAFRLMQQAGHVGKIVVMPPQPAPARAARTVFEPADDGTHLITGGLSGFGLATARWLADQGARHLVLIGRRGVVSEEARVALAELESRDVHVRAEACDVADAAALDRLLQDVRATMPPIMGVVHAAMVLDDGLLANLDRERIARVVKPKVQGAENLDRLTRDDPLDYFVLYSSATTFVGNPGQANYVAANQYLEGLARRRRSEGRPALAVAWGALGDVGYLARENAVRDKLSRRLGHHALSAAEALDSLGRLLARAELDPQSAAVAVAPLDWATAKRELAILASPTYDEILHDAETGVLDAGDRIDLPALLAGRDARESRGVVAGLLAAEVARILKLPSSDVDPQRPLTQIGMDSLTALELRLNVERRLGVEMPLVAMSDETTLTTIAAGIVARLSDAAPAGAAPALDSDQELLARRHLGESVDLQELAPLQEEVVERRAAVGRVLG